MPEIALTAQFLDRFAARFGARPGEWHSGVSARKRARLWRAVAQGEVKVVIGARSALFLPFADLARSSSMKNTRAPISRRTGLPTTPATWRWCAAKSSRSAVILVSATPSIESRVNAAQGRYGHIRLAARFKAKALPAIAAIDLRAEAAPRGKWIAPTLAEAISRRSRTANRRCCFSTGGATRRLTLCRACGHRFSARTAPPGSSNTVSGGR